MRISTIQLQRQQVNAILDQQSRLSETELQVATGKRILTPADDPQAAKVILDLNNTIETTRQYQTNADRAVNRLSLEEGALEGVTTLLQRVRELAVQGRNDSLSDADRKALAVEVRERLKELIELANTRDSNGEYLFAGHSTGTRPFTTDGAGNFSYNGDQGQRFLQISPTLQVAGGDSGSEVFWAIPNGNGVFQASESLTNAGDGVVTPSSITDLGVWRANTDTYTITLNAGGTYDVTDSSPAVVASGTYADGAAIGFAGIEVTLNGTPTAGDTFTVGPSTRQDVFSTVQDLVDALEAGGGDPASQGHFGNAVNRFLLDIDRALDNVTAARAKVGARLNAIDSQKNTNEDTILYAQQNLSQVQDLDYAEATGRLQLQLLGLQAAQQAFVRVQGLSLFNFL
jgi:flagellar hook-associated protein 3 FlgL